jgi:hypothetical protein
MSNNILDDFSPFNNPLKQEIQRHVNKGEQLLWAERPKQGIIFRSSDGCLIPFSLAWGGFAIFWEFTAISMGAPIFMALFGIPFVVIGLYLIVGRFFHDMYLRRTMVYGLTDKQIIIKQGEKLRFVDLSTLTDIQLTEKKDGSGSILFNNKYDLQRNNKRNPSNLSFSPVSMSLGFEGILNVKSVYDQIEELRKL